MGEAERRPSVVVSHVDVVYRVFARPVGGGRKRRGARGVREIHAVKDVSFVAHHGESIGVIGRNGSGKSTLLRAVAGLVPPTNGEVWADGTPSLLGVNAVLVRQLSGARNIYIGAQALGLSRSQVDEVFDEIVEFSGIGDAIHLPMSTYSSGMAARLRFAISTAAVPPVLVIDEALATGDAHFRARSQERIERLRARAGTVFIVSHSAATIRAMCDRALWLDHGELHMDGPVDAVVDAYTAASDSALGGGAVTEPDVPGVERWAGSTRYQVAATVSANSCPDGRDTVVLASGTELGLAASAVPAATTIGASVLLCAPTRLGPLTRKELGRLGARRVVILGGSELMADEVAHGVRDTGVGVERIPGADAAAASLALHADVDAADQVDTVYVAAADDRSAALVAAISAIAEDDCRVLLLPPDGPTPDFTEALDRIGPRRVVVVAEPDVVGEDVVDQLGRSAADGSERLSPGSTVQAAADAAQEFSPGRVGTVFVASSGPGVISDAVSAVVAAGLAGAPLLLVERDEVPAATHTELERLGPSHVVLVGGPLSVSTEVRQTLAGYLRTDGTVVDEADVDL